jgi:hypothetical protein
MWQEWIATPCDKAVVRKREGERPLGRTGLHRNVTIKWALNADYIQEATDLTQLVQNRDPWRTVFTASHEEPVADFVQLTQNADHWWGSFNWLRIEINGGLRSVDSECGSVVDFVELTENMDQWRYLIGSE